MDTRAFFDLLWPATGTYLLAIPAKFTSPKDGKVITYFRHFAYTDRAAAATAAQVMSVGDENTHGVDVYYAMATVKEDLTGLKKAQLDAAGKKVRGVHRKTGFDNTDAMRCFWMDLDVKAAPDAYPDRQQAMRALRRFVAENTLPVPYVVGSGAGLHVYWPMDDSISADEWVQHANILKQVAKVQGLKADPSRTADRASVLRPVGTLNYKTDPPGAVSLLCTGVVSPVDELLGAIAQMATAAPAVRGAPPKRIPVVSINDDAVAGIGAEGPPANAQKVVKRCQQLAWQATHPDDVAEPQWYDMVGCLRHALDGRAAVHIMSKGHADYDADVTDSKIDHHEDGGYGPTLCQTFEDHRPGGCAGCPHLGRIKSPIQLGRELPKAEAPTVTFSSAAGEIETALPEPPYPFKRVADPTTGAVRIVVRTFDSGGNEADDEQVLEHDLYPSALTFDERLGAYICTVRRFLPKDGWSEFDFTLGTLYDRRGLASLMGNIGVIPDLAKVELLVQYMIGYIRELQKRAAATTIYAQLGWRIDSTTFVLPEALITPAGSRPVEPSKNIRDSLSWRSPEGDLDTWRKVVALYEGPHMEGHQFGFGVGFAAPLFKFTNFNGMIVSLVGQAGSGKSSTALCANSIWGHPTMGWTDMMHDTRKAFYEKLGVLQHLPVTYDEITNLDPDLLSDLCYAVSKGQGRRRLNTDGTAKENFGSWQTMMLATSNSSLHSRLQIAKSDASAESVRVFEYHVPANTLEKEVADEAFDKLNTNFGLAGPVFAEFLVKNADAAAARVKHWVKVIDKAAHVTSSERFWSAAPACVLTGFELANACGLTNADIPRLYQFSLRAINLMRGAVVDGIRTPLSVLADYLNGNLRNMLVVTSAPARGKVTMIGREPTGELRVRFDTWDDKLYIDRAHFRRFCSDRRVEPQALRDELFQAGVLLNDKARTILGKGTSYGTAQTWCYVIDASHPDVAGAKPVLVAGQLPPDEGSVGGEEVQA